MGNVSGQTALEWGPWIPASFVSLLLFQLTLLSTAPHCWPQRKREHAGSVALMELLIFPIRMFLPAHFSMGREHINQNMWVFRGGRPLKFPVVLYSVTNILHTSRAIYSYWNQTVLNISNPFPYCAPLISLMPGSMHVALRLYGSFFVTFVHVGSAQPVSRFLILLLF